jgi:hypothetical protein
MVFQMRNSERSVLLLIKKRNRHTIMILMIMILL